MQFPPLLLALVFGFFLDGCLGVLAAGAMCCDVIGLDFEIFLLVGVVVEALEFGRHGCGKVSLSNNKKKSEFKRRYFASGEDHEQHIVTGGGSCDRIDELKEN